MSPDPRWDVAVVGLGPVGATLATLLARTGHRVLVLERWPAPYDLPRAVHMDREVAGILQSCGIGDDLRSVIEPADTYEWRNAEGTTLLRFGRSGFGPSGWPESMMFHQPDLERLLAQQLVELPTVEVRRGCEVTGLSHGVGGGPVVVELADGSSVEASYVVGCDGANSTVRRLADLPVDDLGYYFDWLIVDVVLDHQRVFDPINLQICDPERPTTVVSGGPGRRRWEFMRLPGEELAGEARAWELLAPWDVHPGNARLERHAVYTFAARCAELWRRGPVMVAGDAAHQMPPFAGQGMCAGVRDAANLAWKLDMVLSGHAGASLLDAYQQERGPSVRQAIDFSMELGKVICVADADEASARDAAMSAAVGPQPIEIPSPPGLEAGLVDPGSPHAGTLFAPGVAPDDVHGWGWRLVGDAEATVRLGATTAAWFEGIGGRVVTGAAPGDGDWYADHGVTWALVRPDSVLYGTAADAAGAGALLEGLRRRLAATAAPEGLGVGA